MIYEDHSHCSKTQEYAILSFKSVGINTFNVLVFDVSKDVETKRCMYWHESYQRWESKVRSFMHRDNYFMILSSSGINILAMGETSSKAIADKDGHDQYIHALGTSEYLKIDPSNMIYYMCQFLDNQQINI